MKQEEILFLLGSAVVVVFAWIAFTIVHNSLTSTISGSTTQSILPISGSFDTKTINTMKSRSQVAPEYIIQSAPDTNIVVTSSPTQIPTIVTTTPAASSGGNLQ